MATINIIIKPHPRRKLPRTQALIRKVEGMPGIHTARKALVYNYIRSCKVDGYIVVYERARRYAYKHGSLQVRGVLCHIRPVYHTPRVYDVRLHASDTPASILSNSHSHLASSALVLSAFSPTLFSRMRLH